MFLFLLVSFEEYKRLELEAEHTGKSSVNMKSTGNERDVMD